MSADGSKAPRKAKAGGSGRSGNVCRDTGKWPLEDAAIAAWTDHYFKRTKEAVGRFGDQSVTYALFMRRPVVSAPRLAIEWLDEMAARRDVAFEIDLRYEEGRWVGAGEPLIYLSGPLYHLVDLETLFLQKLGPPCVAAYNAYTMCADLPKVAFLAMDARHCAGTEMAELMAYAASVGSARAKRKVGAVGFIGNANDETAHYFGRDAGMGTMPHALIGYAGSTLRAAEMFVETFSDEPVTVLVDYYGQEITDALAVCRRFAALARAGRISVRLDTHGGRYVEGLDPATSYAVLERHHPEAVREYRADIGIALDGDADRVILVDEKGAIVDGDQILAMCAAEMQRQGTLARNAVVGTVYSNLGLERALAGLGIQLVRSDVGDRYVVETMMREKLNLGGEQSGHLIFLDHITTGDGMLSALKVLALMRREERQLSDLSRVMERVPQVVRNVRVREKPPLEDVAGLSAQLERIESELDGEGRILVRYSGTEPVARVMLEGDDLRRIEALADEVCAEIAAVIGEEA